MRKSDEYIISSIEKLICGRKLVLRWKDAVYEKMIKDKLGITAACYLSEDKKRIDNIETFGAEYFDGKSNEFFIVLPNFKWNAYDCSKYEKLGFQYGIDQFWGRHKPINIYQEQKFGGGQSIEQLDSLNCKIEFIGYGCQVKIGKRVKWPSNCTLQMWHDARIEIGDNVDLGASHIELEDRSFLKIGDNVKMGRETIILRSDSAVFIGEGTTFASGQLKTGRNRKINIGKDCMFSWDTALLGHDGHMIFDLAQGKCKNNTQGEQVCSIDIGNHVWVGGETAILPGTNIEDGCICGYRSLLKGKFPNNVALAGSPAKIIKENVAWTRSNICNCDDEYLKLPEEYRNFTE